MLSNVNKYLATKIIDRHVMSVGYFQLNSGEHSPYYYDFSKFSDSKGLVELGFTICTYIKQFNIEFDVLVGSAYKGIPLCTAAAQYFYHFEHKNIPWTFDRKEPKQHGERGQLVGANVTDQNVLIIDDVITSGKALQRVVQTVSQYKPKSIECLVLIDRRTKPYEKFPYKIHTILEHESLLKAILEHENKI